MLVIPKVKKTEQLKCTFLRKDDDAANEVRLQC